MATDDLTHQRLDAPPEVPQGAVVVGVDGSDPAGGALRWAAAEAARSGAPLHIVCARETYAQGVASLDGGGAWPDIALVDPEDGTEQILEQSRAVALEVAPGLDVGTAHPPGSPARVLVAASKRARLVVVGHRGRGKVAAAFLGTVSFQTAAHARCPVVVVRDAPSPRVDGPRRVVVGIDGSRDSIRAVRHAVTAAAPEGTVVVVNAWWAEVVDGVVVTTPESPQWEEVVRTRTRSVEAAVGDAADEYPQVTIEPRIERGHAVDVLLEIAQDADLLVVGSRGRGGFAGLLLGSVSQKVLSDAPCPVAVVPRERDH